MLENIEKEHMAKQIKVLLLLYSQRRAPSEHDIKAMEQELKNERPREDILVQLMSSTFAARRSLVQSKQVVADILKTYPALRMTAILENEMLLLTEKKIKDVFTKNWRKWIPAIIDYSPNVKKKHINDLNMSVTSELDPDCQQEFALKLLVGLFLSKGKCFDEALKEIYAVYDISCSLEEISVERPPKNAPRIMKLSGGQKNQFFILVEQDVLTEVCSISQAIFSTHYIFDMEYANAVNGVGLFFQDLIFNLTGGGGRKSSYKSIVGELRLYCKGIIFLKV